MKALSLFAAATLAGFYAQPAFAADPLAQPPVQETVGIAAQDGIALGGTNEVIVTRNGVSQTISSELRLENGYRVLPDGNVIISPGNQVMLRPGQIMQFDGTIIETNRGRATPGTNAVATPVAPSAPTITPAE